MPPLAFRWYVSVDMLDLFGELNVMPIILPRNSEFDGDVMGGGFPDFVQAWISSGTGMIATPILILSFLLLFSYIPLCKMMCSRMVVLYVPSFHVSWRKYPFMPFANHRVNDFLQLVIVWDTLCIPVDYSACIRAGISVLVAVHGSCPGER